MGKIAKRIRKARTTPGSGQIRAAGRKMTEAEVGVLGPELQKLAALRAALVGAEKAYVEQQNRVSHWAKYMFGEGAVLDPAAMTVQPPPAPEGGSA